MGLWALVAVGCIFCIAGVALGILIKKERKRSEKMLKKRLNTCCVMQKFLQKQK